MRLKNIIIDNMRKIYFATTNKAKIKSLENDLKKLGIKVEPVNMEIPEIRADETRDVAREKVIYAHNKIKKPCVAQDGGFYISSLNGFPKSYAKFAVNTIGIEGILKLIEGKERNCEFRDTFAYFEKSLEKPVLFEAITRGTIAKEPGGEIKKRHWSELHKIFIPESAQKTFSEMTLLEMNKYRNNGNEWCGVKLAKWLKKHLNI